MTDLLNILKFLKNGLHEFSVHFKRLLNQQLGIATGVFYFLLQKKGQNVFLSTALRGSCKLAQNWSLRNANSVFPNIRVLWASVLVFKEVKMIKMFQTGC